MCIHNMSLKILLSNYAAQDCLNSSLKCNKCNKTGHRKDECPDLFNVKSAATRAKREDDSDDETNSKKIEIDRQVARELCGKCPLCKV